MVASNNKRLIYYLFNITFFCASIFFTLQGYLIKEKLNQIKKNPYTVEAEVSEGYKLLYTVNQKLYVKNINSSGNYNKGDKVKLIVQKDDPEIYLLLSGVDYNDKWLFSGLFLIAAVVMFIFRNKAIAGWRKIAPEY